MDDFCEQVKDDENNPGEYGMDARTRKRLKVGKLIRTKKTKVDRPERSHKPYSMAKVANLPTEEGLNMSKLRVRKYMNEEIKSGTYYVLVDVDVPGGKLVSKEFFTRRQLPALDKKVAKMRKSGRNVQVLDALWFGPAAAIMKAQGMTG